MKTRAFQFDRHGGFEQLTLREQELSEPAKGQAIVRMRAIGLNNSEARYVAGRYAPPPYFPTCLGSEGVGEVVSLGPPDPESQPLLGAALEVGDRVALLPGRIDVPGMGSYREHGLFSQSSLVKLPEGSSDVEGAALWMGALTAGGCFRTAGLSADNAAGRRVVVTAATSGVGVIALQLARAFGAHTIATTRKPEKRAALEALADHVIVAESPQALSDALKSATEGKGFDVAIDPVGAEYLPPLITAAAPLAHIVHYEMISGREPALPLPMLLIKDLSISGFTLFRYLRSPGLLEEVASETLRLGDALRPIVSRTFAFEQAPLALETLVKGEHLGKLVLTLP